MEEGEEEDDGREEKEEEKEEEEEIDAKKVNSVGKRLCLHKKTTNVLLRQKIRRGKTTPFFASPKIL